MELFKFSMKGSKASMGFIFVTILIDIIGIGIIIPVMPTLIGQFLPPGLSEQEIANEAVIYGGFLGLAYVLMQFLFAPLQGMLSDKFGRRPVLLIALFGLGIDYVFHAFAPSIAWLFVGRLLAGVAGASHTVATAYAADISTPENKTKNFGLIGAAFGLGFIIGPFIGGVFGKFGVQLPFLIAAGLSFANTIYGYFVLPESLPKEKRRNINLKYANPVGSLLHLRKYRGALGLIVGYFLLNLAGQSLPSCWSYYTYYLFEWETDMIGYSLMTVGALVAAVQGGLINVFIKKFGNSKTIITGLIFSIVGYLLFAYAHKEWMIFAFLVPFSIGGIAGPTIQSIISNQANDSEQGELQGGLTSLMSLTAIIGYPLFPYIFHQFTDADAALKLAGSPYILGAVLVFLAFLFTVFSFKKLKGTG